MYCGVDWGLLPTGGPLQEDTGQHWALWGSRILAATAMVAAGMAHSQMSLATITITITTAQTVHW